MYKKQIMASISIIVILAGLITAYLIFKPSKTAQIEIVHKTYAGSQNPQETEHIETYEVKSGDIIQLAAGMENLEVTILKVSNESIKMKTNTPISENNTEQSILESEKTNFTVRKEKPLHLVTPTTGGGNAYVFSIMDISSKK